MVTQSAVTDGEGSLTIPDGWQLARIGDHFDFKNGLNKAKEFFGKGTPIVNYLDVLDNPGIRAETIKGRVTVSREEIHSFGVQRGDVLFTRTSETIGEIGMASVILDDVKDTVFSGFILRARPRTKLFDLKFKEYCFRSESVRRQIISMGTKTTRALTSGTLISKVLVPVPSNSEEQSAIGIALSDVHELIAQLDKLIAKKKSIKQGAIRDLLTGRRRLPGFEGKWVQRRFAEIASPRRKRLDTKSGEEPEFCIELEHIEPSSGRILGNTTTRGDSSSRFEFREGDVLFGRLRAYLKKYWLANRSGVCSTEIWVLEPNLALVSPSFLFQVVQTSEFIEIASIAYGTHMPRSDWQVVSNYNVNLPSLAEQSAISQVLSDMGTEIDELGRRRKKYALVKDGMRQQLLTGRIRLQ